MITAEEMLAEALGEEISRELTIDLDTRLITIPPHITTIGVESDDDVLRLPFKIPRYYCDFDLSEFDININYENANGIGDLYQVTDAKVEEDVITFSWLVGRNAVAFMGEIKFIVCLKKYSEEDLGLVTQEFNTTLARMSVLEGLETSEAVVQKNTDLLETWENRLFGLGDSYLLRLEYVSKKEQATIEATAEEVFRERCKEEGIQVPGDAYIINLMSQTLITQSEIDALYAMIL